MTSLSLLAGRTVPQSTICAQGILPAYKKYGLTACSSLPRKKCYRPAMTIAVAWDVKQHNKKKHKRYFYCKRTLPGFSQLIVDFCYNTKLCTSNSVVFSCCVYILMETILYKYGWYRSLDNKFMNLYLTVCWRERRTSKLL